MPITAGTKIFEKVSFNKEADFEKVVEELSDKVFGESTVYLEFKKKIKGNNIGIIPDGYLIDMTIPNEPKLFVIENEIVSHDPFKHIGIQMLKFVTSIEDDRPKVRKVLMEEISKNKKHVKRIEKFCEQSSYRNIDNYLDRAVYSEFKGLVIIDEAKQELYKVLEKINANISVLQIKTYQSQDGEYCYEYDTLYESDDEQNLVKREKTRTYDYDAIQRRRERRANCDTVVVPAREDGFKEEFLKNNRWYSIRIGAAMKDKIKYIAAYQVAPISSITHIAEVHEIKPYKDTGKYILYFKGKAKKISPIGIKDPNKSPQGSVYVKYEDLMKNKFLDESLEY